MSKSFLMVCEYMVPVIDLRSDLNKISRARQKVVTAIMGPHPTQTTSSLSTLTTRPNILIPSRDTQISVYITQNPSHRPADMSSRPPLPCHKVRSSRRNRPQCYNQHEIGPMTRRDLHDDSAEDSLRKVSIKTRQEAFTRCKTLRTLTCQPSISRRDLRWLHMTGWKNTRATTYPPRRRV